MSNSKKDLKAFIRFDGSGRVVAGSLILRKKKPKVGKWYEIPAWECCNSTTTTTTSTTTTWEPNFPLEICVSNLINYPFVNGTYGYVTMIHGKPSYKDGIENYITWSGLEWEILTSSLNLVARSTDVVDYPTLVTNWITAPDDNELLVIEGACRG